MTRLQKQAYRSKAVRRAFYEYMETETGKPAAGYKRLYNELLGVLIDDMSDYQIMDFLCSALQCDDITAGERREIVEILL